MKYSVIVSIYKVEEFLPRCVESILSQTYSDFEVILVNDGSPDNCPDICDEYAKRDPRVRVIHKENGGLMSTRKLGAVEAQGDYLCFVDGDDFWSVDVLKAYEDVLQAHSVDMICAGYNDFFQDEINPRKQNIPCGLYDKRELERVVYPRMLSYGKFFSFGIFPCIWSKCIRKEIARKVYARIPDELSLGEDVAAVYPSLLNSNSVYLTDYCGYMYRRNAASMTRTYNKKLYAHLCNLLSYLNTAEKTDEWESDGQIACYAVYLLRYAVTNEFRYNKQESYKNKRKNLGRYLKNELFKAAIKSCRVTGLKNRFCLFCFRNNITLPFLLMQ